MRPLKRLAISMNAQFSDVINQLENHEAVADCVLKEVEQAAAKAKVQHARVRNDQRRLEGEAERTAHEIALWRERAVKSHAVDERRALECVRRAKRGETDLAR